MKKKLLITLITLTAALTITACGNSVDKDEKQTNNVNKTDKLITEDTADTDDEGTSKNISNTTDRDLLDLSKDEQKKEIRRHTAIIVEAIKNLDYDTLALYLRDDKIEGAREGIERLKNNPEDVDFWNKTVGTMIYFEDSDVLLYKSVDYTMSAWYTDCWKNNADIPEDSSKDFSDEYLEEIYNKYYAEAPYEAICKASDSLRVLIEDDGSVSFYPLFHDELREIIDSITTDYTNMKAAILLTEENCFSLGYEYIMDPSNNPDYELFMNKDLDAIMNRAVELGVVDLESTRSKSRAYKNYFMEEANKIAIQDFLNNQCTVLRDLHYIRIFAPVNIEKTFPFYVLTREDKETLRNMNLNLVHVISFSSFNADENDFMFFNDLSDSAIENGIVDFI